ncbi:MAG TPA: nuclear transport factor 2 family protein [Thermoanaerobaculia bacterium]|nr:nuclear transport factor 2 family protein [Thermoanaerobaculia bacterium]
MKIVRLLAPGVVALACLSCKSGGAAWEPVVIDISATRTPSPTATPAAVLTMTAAPAASSPAPTASPTPIPTPPPAPASPVPESPRPALAAARTAESVAQSRIEAYNRRDIEALVGLYAPDARLYEPPDRLRDSGIEQIRQTFMRRFASAPSAKITLTQRMTQGNFVVDREVETGGTGQPESGLVISEIREGKIVRVWTLK